MSLGDTLKRFTLADNFIVNALGNLVGIKNPNANGNDLRVDNMPAILAQSGVPVILPSSGSANGSGVITHTTALPYQPTGTVQIYLPAGVVTGGSQGSGAGLYSVVYSSTTVCQIAGTGITTTAGAYTQTTGSVTLASVTVPGGAMGPNGSLRMRLAAATPNNANNKQVNSDFGGVNMLFGAITTQLGFATTQTLHNRGSAALQYSTVNTGIVGTGGTSPITGAVDTTNNQTWRTSAQLAVATDYIVLEVYTLELLPGLQ